MSVTKILFSLVSLSILLYVASNIIIPIETVYYQSLGNNLDIERIETTLSFAKKWQWLGYAILPFVILIRVFYTSIFLFIGVFFTELKIEFEKLFKIALIADFVYVLSGLAKLIILIFFRQVSTLEDLQFQPLSAMELLNSKNIDQIFVYPLSLLNVFELGYFAILAWLLFKLLNESDNERPVKFGHSLKLVTVSYGSGLLLWVLTVMFVTLNLS
ncbi:hypothetical protein OU798_20125 [Prolixibacteraceae bacterium Z1-6]|uniref:Uncharacterized protein n=1 Tax=Draconibacterium aestuarii TaxID=2998507 RepID=A0A9X3J7N6_9BACT|nr:hypothetical protein [Prolixibacteraceae bacterium Z1-6]